MSAPTPPAPPADLAARRLNAAGRVGVALAVTALASVEALPVPGWAAWVGGLVWLPAATLLLMVEEGPSRRWRAGVGIAMDLAALVGVMLLIPQHAATAALLLVPLAGSTTYRSGVAAGLLVTALGLAGRTGAHALTGDGIPIDWVHEVATGLAAVSVVAMLAVAGRIRRQDTRRAIAMADTADTIMARSAEAIVVTDPDGVVVQVNDAAERVLASPAGEGLAGTACGDRLQLHTRTGQPLDCRTGCALAAMCEDAGTDAVEVWRPLGDGRQPLLASATSIRDQHGELQVLHSFRDITKLKEADEAKTMFLATASHELKTPLTVIRGFTQLLQRTVTDPDAAVALQAIDGRSRELAAIVDRLLLSSRIEAGRVDLALGAVDVGALLRDRLPDLAVDAGCPVEGDLGDELVAHANAEAVVTVVGQLVDNAAKYSMRQGVVRVGGRRNRDGVVIEVADDGIGMTPAQIERCFEKFWQAEPSDVRRFGGTGIGLYIVRSLVEAMGGRVRVTSAVGVGSTFAVTLPAAIATAPAADDEGRLARPVTVDEFMTQLGIRSGAA